MGLLDYLANAAEDSLFEAVIGTFWEPMGKLLKSNDPNTVAFTNVRRIDDVAISSYAIDAAVDDDSPVWLLSDQGKILLTRATADVDIARTIVPPEKGEYILICDYAAARSDFRGRYFSYTRVPNLISNDIVAYYFDVKNHILVCSTEVEVVKTFKEIIEYRQKKLLPEITRTNIEISREDRIFFLRPWQSWSIFSNYDIYVDGVKVDEISSGESKFLAMTPGRHELRIRNVFGLEVSDTINFEIEKNQHLKFSCKYIPKAYIPVWFLFDKKVIGLTKIN